MSDEDEPMNIQDAENYSGFSREWLYRLAHKGLLGKKIARHYTFTKRELDAYKSQKHAPGPKPNTVRKKKE